ncbi:metal ABC transporter ATP-binding protein [Bacteroidota bacterium]
MSVILNIKDLIVSYNGNPVLENINLQINKNDFIGIIGPNGGGKTTLIKTILGLKKPQSGKIEFNNTGNLRPNIGYLPQVKEIDRKFPISVIDVVLSGLMSNLRKKLRFSRKERKLAKEILEKMGVTTLTKKPIGELSGGQAQRVFLSRALVSSPEILVLDEPDTYVDSNFENELYQLLQKINENTTIIIATHDVGSIVSYVKNIACVNKTLHYHPSNEITNELLKSYNCPIDLVTHGTVPHRVLHKH